MPSNGGKTFAWARPWLILIVLAPFAASVVWAVTKWQIERDANCAHGATIMSCGLSANDAATFVFVSALISATAAAVAEWISTRRKQPNWVAWTIAVLWLVAVNIYAALPPSS